MALPHAAPLDLIDVRPLAQGLRGQVNTSLLKTPELQLLRLVLPAGQGLAQHDVAGAITIHCLEGEARVTTPTRECRLQADQLVMLPPREPHAVTAVDDCSLLVTIVLHAAPTA